MRLNVALAGDRADMEPAATSSKAESYINIFWRKHVQILSTD